MKQILNQQGEIRVRFAPSPTGFFHIGSARAALFNYLFAKQNKGSFILRIEDTDKERSFSKYEKDITDSLDWLGIYWDEGPKNGGYVGDFEPYRQSERNVYEKYIEKLLKQDKVYYCFCSQQDLEAEKQYQMARGEAPRYSGKCSNLQEKPKQKSSVIRLRVPEKKIKFKDIIRGEIEFDTNTIGDIVIAKDKKRPLYNLAVVIDDYEMNISHVIRGEDHISNTPKQIAIIESLGFNLPEYAHFPMVLAPDRSKLSKRHGPVSVIDYKNDGYLPEALINFLAFLGWNPGTDREVYSMNSLIKDFSLKKVQKSPAIFNIKKLDFINGFYIRHKNIEDLTQMCIPYLIKSNYLEKDNLGEYRIKNSNEVISLEIIQKIISLHQERMKKLSEISDFTDFFFNDTISYPSDLLIWKNSNYQETLIYIDKIYNILSKIDNWQKDFLQQIIMETAEKESDRGKIFWPLRVSLTGKKSSAGPIEVAEILGKEKTLKRIKQAKEKLNV